MTLLQNRPEDKYHVYFQQVNLEIDSSLILTYILRHVVFIAADATDIKKAYEINQERATNILLDKLIESPHRGKWQAFVEALENSGMFLYIKQVILICCHLN